MKRSTIDLLQKLNRSGMSDPDGRDDLKQSKSAKKVMFQEQPDVFHYQNKNQERDKNLENQLQHLDSQLEQITTHTQEIKIQQEVSASDLHNFSQLSQEDPSARSRGKKNKKKLEKDMEENFAQDIEQEQKSVTEEAASQDGYNFRRHDYGKNNDPSFAIEDPRHSKTISQTEEHSEHRTVLPSGSRPTSRQSDRSSRSYISQPDSSQQDVYVRADPSEKLNPELVFKWRDDVPADFDEWYLEKCINMLQEDKNNLLAHLRLYFIYKKKQDYSNARVHLLKIIAIDPNFKADAVLFFLGETFQLQGDYEQALSYYKKCYKQTQEKYLVLLYMGNCYIELKQHENAQKAFEQAVFINSKSFTPYYKLGLIQLQVAQHKKAVDNLQKAHSL